MVRWLQRHNVAGSVPALFLHIQKTAGTSLVNMARRYYGNDVVSHGDCWGKPPEQFSQVRFISGHLGYSYMRPLIGDRYSFTFLRNPVDRILSMYYFCRSRDPAEFDIYRRAHEMDLPGFLMAGLTDPMIKARIWNNQVWQLAHGYTHLDSVTPDDFSGEELLSLAKKHLAEFSYIGFTETFAADADLICKALKFPKRRAGEPIQMENVTPRRPGFAEQSAEVKKLLMDLTELDRELYDHARRARTANRWW